MTIKIVGKLVPALLVALSCACGQSHAKVSDAVVAEHDTAVATETPQPEPAQAQPTRTGVPRGAAILLRCYPDHIKDYRDGKLVMADGSTIVYDDGRDKSFVEKLDDADPEDMFAFTYDLNSWTPQYQQDAGRSRCEQLFKKMYGASAAAVQRNLVTVKWFGQNVQFTRVNGAADSLRAVAAELARHPALKKHLHSSGSFYWRKVRGAKRQSAHSYGMTIDIGVAGGGGGGDYWQWRNPGKGENARITYFNHMPHEVVEIFERHGFIWGGRWYHYDTMHFEFRPEILMNEQLKTTEK